MERYSVFLLIQSECGENAEQNNSDYADFLRSANDLWIVSANFQIFISAKMTFDYC